MLAPGSITTGLTTPGGPTRYNRNSQCPKHKITRKVFSPCATFCGITKLLSGSLSEKTSDQYLFAMILTPGPIVEATEMDLRNWPLTVLGRALTMASIRAL